MNNVVTTRKTKLALFIKDEKDFYVQCNLLSNNYKNLEDVVEFVEALREITDGQKTHLLFRNFQIGPTSADVRRYVAKTIPTIFEYSAVVTHHSSTRILHLFLSMMKIVELKHKFFKDEQMAKDWLTDKVNNRLSA